MIPADVASRLRLVLPDQPAPPQAVAPTQQLADVLSDLVPGQRILAEIQALLPNGTYRATIAQRDVTLALPFSAKQGDTLELEVVEKGGKLTFAVVTNRDAAPSSPGESVPTTLSPTGRLIGDLLGGIGEEGKRAQPAPLNGNQPLVAKFPDSPAELVPVLKEALVKSGMFYESHQAQWVAGTMTKEALLQEPQGKLSPNPSPAMASAPAPQAPPQDQATSIANKPPELPTSPQAPEHAAGTPVPAAGTTTPGIPPELTPLIQQQLDALSTQNFVWQGQIWPGQQMQWEIEDNPESQASSGNEESARWRTRLKLSLPRLGSIEAALQLRGNGDIELNINSDNDDSRRLLTGAGEKLGRQLADAGLRLTVLHIDHGPDAG